MFLIYMGLNFTAEFAKLNIVKVNNNNAYIDWLYVKVTHRLRFVFVLFFSRKALKHAAACCFWSDRSSTEFSMSCLSVKIK